MALNRPPIILIHGFRGSSDGLKQLSEQLSDYNVFIPDLPPAEGQSLLKYNANRYAEWMMSYITKNKLQKPVLVGHSMGSLVAAATAQNHPELINEKIIFLAPISSKPNPFFAALSPLTAILPNKFVDFISTKYLITSKNPVEFNRILELTHTCSSTYKSKSDIFKSALFPVKNCLGDFSFNKDTLIIAGATDRLIPQKNTTALAEAIDAKSVLLENTGHLLNYEQPEAVAEAIRQFLASDE